MTTTFNHGTTFTDEQLAFAESIRDFCQRECGTREQRDALTDNGKEAHNQALYEQMAQLGWAGVAIPEEYGGVGGSLTDYVIFFHETWKGLAPVFAAGSVSTCLGVYKRGGTDDQKQRALPAMAEGTIYAISISEPEAGSDVANVKTRAQKADGGWVLNGQKTWCSAAHQADHLLLLARTSKEESRHDGLTIFEIPTDAQGVEIRGIETLMGREVNDIFLTDVFVPDDAVVGPLGKGWKLIMAGLNSERLIVCAQGMGACDRTLSDLLSYVKERKQFGAAIGTFQALRHRIADLAIDIEAGRALVYDTVLAADLGSGAPEEIIRRTSMSKVKMTEVAKHVTLEAVQMMGGYGYATEYGMERQLRLSIAPTIYAGTNEVQREIISSTYGLR